MTEEIDESTLEYFYLVMCPGCKKDLDISVDAYCEVCVRCELCCTCGEVN